MIFSDSFSFAFDFVHILIINYISKEQEDEASQTSFFTLLQIIDNSYMYSLAYGGKTDRM